ncbi:pyrophosphatase PpaX [Ornithinibacillus halophilus]|uniref:Pyrophosphatase PpaX n=1 Tax=Ornithinibacillus halophilus TaxID=930117 RepID=A0A1M5F1L5_9BACI|nr:pyrophosphatase PpaX [Ornithinibacillus halophilus]SHF85111.1 pyrophosphatase PpaX [Ornithinibacillus halophilus]
MSIRTILFDLDGTLIDTNDLIMESFLHTFQQYGLEFTREELLAFNGPPLKETFENINLDQAEAMIQTYRDHNLHHHDNYVKAFPHVVDTVNELKDKGIKLAIVTTKMRKTAIRGLKVTGLYEYFDTIVALDDVFNAKPHPESVLQAMEILDAEPDTTLMVGDNSHDIEAGHNADVLTAGVSWSLKGREFLQQYKPTYMVEDIRELLSLV